MSRRLTKDQQKTVERFDPRRGTALWGMNRLREDALPHLLDDLLVLEQRGLDGPTCAQVKLAIGKIVNAATTIPDGGLLKPVIWKQFAVFESLYHDWNSREGEDDEAAAHRRGMLQKLRKRRHKIAKSIRRNQHILANELDFKLIDACYDAVSDLTKAVPNLFVNLSKALLRFKVGKAI